MSDPKAPRVFLSHASEDKDRFVIPFARALRRRGLDVWVDRWEMLPGDSLVEKIFEEGIGSASAMIVVLSRSSLSKPWVVEELDAGIVKRIETGSRLIPIVLDGLAPTDLPQAIQHLLFESVADTSDITDVVNRVVRSVFGGGAAPEVGEQPRYASSASADHSGLNHTDSVVLRAAGEEAVRDSGTRFVTADFLETLLEEFDMDRETAIESLEVLDELRYIEVRRTLSAGLEGMRYFTLKHAGMERFLRSDGADYERQVDVVSARLAGWAKDQGTVPELTEATGFPSLIVRHILESLESRGLLKLSRTATTRFYNLSPRLRRLA
ncbi:MAG: toll/interleukin-1 receptor domain-containing protein [Acidobacteria bacterium]|nr:toll/interleukin-1 receptor domain-containing protein [Acidobacteriota bacterium]